MASRAYHLVLRGVPARAFRTRLSAFSRGLGFPVQFLLPDRRPDACASATGTVDAADAARSDGLSGISRRRDAGFVAAMRQRSRSPGTRRAGIESRAAAPGIAADGHPSFVLIEPVAAGAPRIVGDAKLHTRSAALYCRTPRHCRDRPLRRRVRLRQRSEEHT